MLVFTPQFALDLPRPHSFQILKIKLCNTLRRKLKWGSKKKEKNILWTWDKNKSCCSVESSFTGISSKFLISHQESLSSTYFVGGPRLPVRPVHVVPDVPPLDLQRVGGRPGPSEGAGHLHVLPSVCCHVVRHLGEHGWTQNWAKLPNGAKWIKKQKEGGRKSSEVWG